MRLAASATLLLLCGCTPAREPVDLAIYPEAAGMPADVQDFMIRHQGCLHWMGEPGEHPVRIREINRMVRRLCPGIDARARRLRARYAADPAIVARLASFEPLEQ